MGNHPTITHDLLSNLAGCIEMGKAEKDSPYPPALKGQEGSVELTRLALESDIAPQVILKQGLMPGMDRIGEKFSVGEVFIPDLLMSADAMNKAMAILKPHFGAEGMPLRGTMILGTVAGDLHEIGKNVVRMVLEGDGWQVIDLGVDVTVEKFIETLRLHPGAVVGMSALLTTTMATMQHSVRDLKALYPEVAIYVGGAPLTSEFAAKIGAEGFFPDPHTFARHLATKY
jgi:methanogenic corrinoid protein MtbC1